MAIGTSWAPGAVGASRLTGLPGYHANGRPMRKWSNGLFASPTTVPLLPIAMG